MKIKVGERAPEFTLSDQFGKPHNLSDFKGEWVLLYFYPKDNTPGCTKEACTLKDNFAKFAKFYAQVIGVSVDSVQSHDKFAKKYELPFIILSDKDRKVVELYGVWGRKKFMGKEYYGTSRMSFLIDSEGKVAKIYEKVKPADHAKEVLDDLQQLVK